MVKYRLTWRGSGALDLSQILDDQGQPILFTRAGDVALVNASTFRHPLVQNYIGQGLQADEIRPGQSETPPVYVAPPPPRVIVPPAPPVTEPVVDPTPAPSPSSEAPQVEVVAEAEPVPAAPNAPVLQEPTTPQIPSGKLRRQRGRTG